MTLLSTPANVRPRAPWGREPPPRGAHGRKLPGERALCSNSRPRAGKGGMSKEDAIQMEGEVVETLPNTDRKSTRLNSSHSQISYAVFCLKKKSARQCRESGFQRLSPRPM